VGRDDFWRRFARRPRPDLVPVTIDLTPPRLELLAATRYVSPGGAVLVAFARPTPPRGRERRGARLPELPYGPPIAARAIALIALPYDSPRHAADGDGARRGRQHRRRVAAGRAEAARLPQGHHHTERGLSPDEGARAPAPAPAVPAATRRLLDRSTAISASRRKREKLKIGAKTADKPLWEGPFTQPRNTKVFSNFAETRTYVYAGKPWTRRSTSASTSPPPSSHRSGRQRGQVAFAGPLTIYGNAVIVDHGLGLQTLYAHLSSIDVKLGDMVTKGQQLGHSGSTGLAVGDHLHFEVLVSGVSVTPWSGGTASGSATA
jgi:hypothetical protein